MRSRRSTIILATAAAIGCALSLGQPSYSGRERDSYVQERRVIRAGILVYGGYATVPSPYAMFLLASESVYVALEPYTDSNGNGRWDAGEPYTDSNGNGRFDAFEFHPPRPPGWEIINPLAVPGLDKSQPAYWAINMAVTPLDLSLLQNFDLLLLPVMGTGAGLTAEQQQALERWVDQGGLLWVDNQPDHPDPPNPGVDPRLGAFFLRPLVQFGVRNRNVAAPKAAADPNHPLLRSRYALSDDELQWLGQQYAYGAVGAATNAGLSPLDGIGDIVGDIVGGRPLPGGVNNPFAPNDEIGTVTVPQEIVGEWYQSGEPYSDENSNGRYDLGEPYRDINRNGQYDSSGLRYRAPVIAAGRYGDGCIVLSACAVAAGINDWYQALLGGAALSLTELPQWALPDMKLAYNMIQWWMDWSGAHGRVRSRGDYAGAVPTPPLLAWEDVETLSGPLGGPACVGRGLAFAGSASGVLGAWDAKPYLDRDLRDTPIVLGAIGGSPEIKSDDGVIDYALGFGRDLLWRVVVPWQDPNDPSTRTSTPARQVVGAPAVATTYSRSGRPRWIVSATRAANVVTVATLAEHGFSIGDLVIVAGILSNTGSTWFNGTFAVTGVPDSTTFTYAQAGANDTGSGGAAYAVGLAQLVAVAVKTTDNLDSSLHAYLADAVDANLIVGDPSYPDVTPLWSATVKHHARPDLQDSNGLVSCGPVAVDGLLALLTTDSGTLEAPNRDAHFNLYDVNRPSAAGGDIFEAPAASLEMTRGGRAMSLYNSPAVARIGAYDAIWRPTQAQPVEAAVMTGNSLPRPGPSAVGWLYVTPLMVRVPAPGWDRTWEADLNASGTVDDISADQTVQVYFPNAYGNPGGPWIQVPPHVGDDPTQPLNYVRTVTGGQISITFTNWSMFGWGPASDNKYPLGFGDIWIRYRDTQGNWRDLRPVTLTPGTPIALNGLLNGVGSRTASVSGFVNEDGHATPCVTGDSVYVGSDAVKADPSPSSEGQIASYSLAAPHVGDLQWRFIGDRYSGPAAGPGGYLFSSFSFTPAYAGDTLFAVSNYQFLRNVATQTNQSIVPSGALYALDVKASPELVNPGTASPVFPSDIIDASAPLPKSIEASPAGAARTANVVTIATSAAHGLLASQQVLVAGVTSVGGTNFNGTFVITGVPTLTTFTYAQAGADDTGGGGYAYPWPVSADPNQVVPPGRAGAAVWISTSLNDDSPRYAIPQVAATYSNWRVDFQNRIIRLGPGAFGDLACPVWDAAQGRYVAQQVRVCYFGEEPYTDTNVNGRWDPGEPYTDVNGNGQWDPSGVLQGPDLNGDGRPDGVVMKVAPMVRWMYLAPDGWEFVSSPVVAGDTVMVVAYDHGMQRCLLLGFPAAPEATTDAPYPLWAFPARPEFVQVLATGVPAAAPCSLAVADGGIVWSGSVAGLGGVAGLESPETVIADTDRLLAADAGGRALTVQDAAWHMRPDTALGLGGIPINYSYADMTFDSLNRPARVRTLPNGNLLVVNSGASSVVELDGARQVVWRYPNDDPAADRGGMTAEQARLLDPSDAQRYYYEESVVLASVYDPEGLIQANSTVVRVEWETTLIADTGNYRVLEVARPLVNGRYRPDLENGAHTARLYVELVREIAGPTITSWPTAAGGATSIQAAFTTVARFAGVNGLKPTIDATYPFLSANIMCAVGNHPNDPLGQDRFVRLVEISITYAAYTPGQPLGVVASDHVVGRGSEGINVFRARISPQFARDFLGIRQADQTVVLVVDPNTGTGSARHQTLIVDDVGVKVVDDATWNDPAATRQSAVEPGYLTPVFEMRGPAPAAPEAALTTYQQEMAGLQESLQRWVTDPATAGVYPPLISEPRLGLDTTAWNALRASALEHLVSYAQAGAGGAPSGEIQFLPTFAKRLRNGMYLIVNGYPNPYLSGGPLDVMARSTSEVFMVDPSLWVGQRIVRTLDQQPPYALDLYTWDHFIVPDPGRSEYPRLRGGAAAVPVDDPDNPGQYLILGGVAPLRQPRAADMR